MRTVLKVMLGILLAGVVMIVGCAALLGTAANEVQEDSDKTAITLQQYGSAKVGQATRSRIEADFGKPRSSDEIQAEGVAGIPESDFSQSCIYFSRKGQLASLFQFCFDGNGKLRSKASY